MINPHSLFSDRINNYQTKTEYFGFHTYVNLDSAATTPPFKCVEEAVYTFMSSYGSVHRGAGVKSVHSTAAYERSRQVIKEFVNAPEESYVLFTCNTTGAMNVAAQFFSFLKGSIAVSSIEHSSSWLPWVLAEGVSALSTEKYSLEDMAAVNLKIQELGNTRVVKYPLDEDGEFDLEQIETLLKSTSIKAFVLTASSNLTGYIPQIKAIATLVHEYGCYLVLDACQYIQHYQLNMRELGVDFLAASGHKFYAPFGGGFLIGPKRFFDSFLPYQIGGGNLPYISSDNMFLRHYNEQAHDSGTPNAVGAISMAAALLKLKDIGISKVGQYEKRLATMIFQGLSTTPGVSVHLRPEHLSTVVPFSVDGVRATTIAERLNREFGIGVRAGSFCVYQVVRDMLRIEDESHIIEAIKKNDLSVVPSVVRVSVSLCNTEDDIQRFLYAISKIVESYSLDLKNNESSISVEKEGQENLVCD